MKLSTRTIETLKPKEREYKIFDGEGLFILVKPNGSKLWRYKYRFDHKEKLISLGAFPGLSLAEARLKRAELKVQISKRVDPSIIIKQLKLTTNIAKDNTFINIATEWHTEKAKVWSPKYSRNILTIFNRDVFPSLGYRPITEIEPLEILTILRRIEDRGALETASKTRQRISEVYKYAIITGRALTNPAEHLSGALTPQTKQHYAFLPRHELAGFVNALSGYAGSYIAKRATQLLMYTGLRTAELRSLTWENNINFDQEIIFIDADVMKKNRPHIVPMSSQVKDLLKEMYRVSGTYNHVFIGRNNQDKSISENTILGVIRRVGYEGRMTGHGFRHTMSTILNEEGYNKDWIELQLAHVDKNSIRGTYNHAQYLEQRRDMLQGYADFIDALLK